MLNSDRIDLKPLVLGCIAWNSESNIEEQRLYYKLKTIVEKLNSHGIDVELEDYSDQIEMLLSFWISQNYIEKNNNYICIIESKKQYFNKEFVLQRLFDRRSIIAKKVASTFSEVFDNEDEDFSGPGPWICTNK